MEKLAKQILTISYELGLSHIGSNLSVLPILMEIYKKKKPEDIVILDNAHAHLAHLVVQNANYRERLFQESDDTIMPIKDIIKKDIHCNREAGCDASGGSLGHGIGIGIGYALVQPWSRDVYVITSDGAMNEGSNWEALRLKDELKLNNLKIYINCNGFTATGKSEPLTLEKRIEAFAVDGVKFINTTNGISFLNGINGHYDILTKETYEQALKEIDDNERLSRLV